MGKSETVEHFRIVFTSQDYSPFPLLEPEQLTRVEAADEA